MAIYLRTCPTTSIKVLGCLGALAAAGIALLYPLILLMTAFALGALDEAVAYPEDNESIANAATAVGATPLIFSLVLTSVIFGATSCFTGTDRWLAKDATVTYRDIASARFLHVARDPNSRAVGMLWAMHLDSRPGPHRPVRGTETRCRTPAGKRGTPENVRHGGRGPKVLLPPPAFQPWRPQHPRGPGALGSREGPSRLRPTRRRCRAGATGHHPAARPDGETLTARRRPLPGRGPARRGLAGRTADTSLSRAGRDGRRPDIGG